MGYNILRFKHHQTTHWGVQKGNKISPFGIGVDQLSDLLTKHLGEAAAKAKDDSEGTFDLDSLQIISPVTRPTRLLCLGLNYYEHRDEAQAHRTKTAPLFFRKDESAIIGPTDDIQWPKGCHLLDYEVEMGLIMKKAITAPTQITKENIGDYVGGMILANDMSPRDLMFFTPFSQWFMGKSWRCMCPLGPSIYIFEEGEAAKIHEMEIKLWVNDELRQDAHTKDMITKPEKALTLASESIDLAVGDVVLTGTPGGVAIQAPSKMKQNIGRLLFSEKKLATMMVKGQLKSGRFLKDGDVVRCSLKSADGSIDCGEQRSLIVKKG